MPPAYSYLGIIASSVHRKIDTESRKASPQLGRMGAKLCANSSSDAVLQRLVVEYKKTVVEMQIEPSFSEPPETFFNVVEGAQHTMTLLQLIWRHWPLLPLRSWSPLVDVRLKQQRNVSGQRPMISIGQFLQPVAHS